MNKVETGDVNVNVETGDQEVKVIQKTSAVKKVGGGYVAGASTERVHGTNVDTTYPGPSHYSSETGKGGGKGIPVPISAPTGPGLATLISSIIGGGGLLTILRRGL